MKIWKRAWFNRMGQAVRNNTTGLQLRGWYKRIRVSGGYVPGWCDPAWAGWKFFKPQMPR